MVILYNDNGKSKKMHKIIKTGKERDMAGTPLCMTTTITTHSFDELIVLSQLVMTWSRVNPQEL